MRYIGIRVAYGAETAERKIDKFTRADFRRVTGHDNHQDKITCFFTRQAIPIDRATSSIYLVPLLCKVHQTYVLVKLVTLHGNFF